MQIQSGGHVDIEDTFNCATGQCVGLYNDAGSIANSGTITVGGTYNCSKSTCDGLANNSSITNSSAITIQGTYSCSTDPLCVGVGNDGSITDVDCGTLSPQTFPYFLGNPILTSGTCTKVGVPQFPLGLVGLIALIVPVLLVFRKRALSYPS